MVDVFQNDFWGQNISLADSHKSFRPLVVLTYRMNYLVHGFSASGYHLVNVLLFSVSCLACLLVSWYWVDSFGENFVFSFRSLILIKCLRSLFCHSRFIRFMLKGWLVWSGGRTACVQFSISLLWDPTKHTLAKEGYRIGWFPLSVRLLLAYRKKLGLQVRLRVSGCA